VCVCVVCILDGCIQQALKKIFISLLPQITTQWPASKSRYAGVPPPEMGVGFAIEYSMRCTNQPAIWWDQDKARIPKDKCCRTRTTMMMMMTHSTHVYSRKLFEHPLSIGFLFLLIN
jgi:hypothetical protein